MSSNQYTVNIVNADELYIGGRKIEALELGVLVSDDPTYGIGIGTDKPRLRLDISGNSGIRIPVGTTSERPVNGRFLNPPNGATNLLGILRYNTTTEKYEAVCDSESLSVDPSWCNFVMETGTVGNNKVGINTGTGIPSQTLDVSGQIGINDYIIHNGNTDTKIGFPTNDTLTITTNGTERMRVDSSGKVGIGVGHSQTTKSELHVKGSISVYKNARNSLDQAQLANIYLDVNATGKGSGIIWKPEYDDGGNPYTKDSAGIYFQRSTAGFITGGLGFYTNDSATYSGVAEERMRIDATGNVGIGTTSPDYKLEVAGNCKITEGSLVVDGKTHSGSSEARSDYALQIGKTGTRNYKKLLYVGGVGKSNYGSVAVFESDTDNASYTFRPFEFRATFPTAWNAGRASNGASIFMINNICSGTSSGTYYNEGSNFLVGNNLYSANRTVIFNVKQNGNVGIGTASPSAKLHINETGVSQQALRVSVPNNHSGTIATFERSGAVGLRISGSNGWLCMNSSYALSFSASNQSGSHSPSHMLINDVGNVGIGTTSPSEKLEVNGTCKITNRLEIISHGTAFQITGGHTPARGLKFLHSGGTYYADFLGIDYLRFQDGYALKGFNIQGHNETLDVGKIGETTHIRLYGNGHLYATSIITSGVGWLTSSDLRIKNNIETIPDDLALQTFRSLDAKYYNYIDNAFSDEKQFGFIAQEVKEAIPEAVKLMERALPDEQRVVDVLWNITNNNSYSMELSSEVLAPGKYEFHFTEPESESYGFNGVEMLDTLDGKTFQCKGKTWTLKTKYSRVELYGSVVSDFHTIIKDKIFTVAYAALQEVDKTQQKHAATISAAEAKLTAAEAEIATLKSTLTDVLSRLAALELN